MPEKASTARTINRPARVVAAWACAWLLLGLHSDVFPAEPSSPGNAVDSQTSHSTIHSGLGPSRTMPAQVPNRSAVTLPPHRSDEVLLKFKDGATQAQRNAVLAGLSRVPLKRVGADGTGLVRLSGMSVQQAINAYRQHPDVAYIEPNYIVRTQATPDDPAFDLQWGLFNSGQTGGIVRADIQAREAWDVFTGTADIIVAVLDSGIDLTHPDLQPNIFVNPGEIADNGIDDDGNGFVDDTSGWNFVERNNDATDDSGHGTHVSGILGAAGNNGIGIAGTSWDVTLLPVRFLNAGGFGATAQAIESIDYAIAMNARIINASWGSTGFSTALRDAIARAGEAGIIFVAASGNANPALDVDVTPFYPGSYDLDNVISVAASDHNEVVWPFSNFGDESVDLAAPGVLIFSTEPGGYGYRSGTSMAAPYVSGAVALMLGRFPDLGVTDARALLLQRTDLRESLAEAVIDGARLNALKPIAIDDTTPPAAIADLTASDTDGEYVDLVWTATGDDGDTGRANRYELRYSTEPIDAASFVGTTPAPTPEPAPVGSLERVRVQGLTFETEYYFAVKALDELGNASDVSNVVLTLTLPPPVVDVQPTALADSLEAGSSSELTFTIENSGPSDYNFDLIVQRPLQGATPAAARTTQPLAPGPDAEGIVTPMANPAIAGENEDGFLRILFLGSGTLSQEILAEMEAIDDVAQVDLFDATSFTPLLSDLLPYDAIILTVNIPYLNSNGIGDVVADYVDAGGGVVMTLASLVNGWQIGGRFRDDGYYPVELGTGPIGSSDLGVFDADHPIMRGVSEATGHQLADLEVSEGAEVIAEWSIGEPFVVVRNGIVGINVFVLNGNFWTGDIPLILTNAAFWTSRTVSWLDVDPESGTVLPGERRDITVKLNTTNRIAGDYEAEVAVQGNDPALPEVRVQVDLRITGMPDIRAGSSLEFGEAFIGESTERAAVIENLGTDTLTVFGLTLEGESFTAATAGFTLAPSRSQSVAITFAPAVVGANPGQLRIESDDPDTPSITVALNGAGLDPPQIAVTPERLSAELNVGERDTLELRMDNAGANELHFELRLERADAAFTFQDNFEDGDLDGWLNGGTGSASVTSETAAGGSKFSLHESFGVFGHFNGMYRELGLVQPGYVGFRVRSGSTLGTDAFFVLRDSQGQDVIWFYAQPTGDLYVNADVGGHDSYPYEAETWYHVEFKNIRFESKRFDYYVDGALIQEDVPFRTPAEEVARLDVYGFQASSRSWWDEIFISSHPPVVHVQLDRALGSVPAGGSLTLPVVVDATEATQAIGGDYPTGIMIETNVPEVPEVAVPVDLTIRGTPLLQLNSDSLDFGSVFIGNEETLAVSVLNAGTDVLMIHDAEIDHPDYSIEAADTAIAVGQTVDFPIRFEPQASGISQATLTLSSNANDRPTALVSLRGEGVLAPKVEVTPVALHATVSIGETLATSLTVRNGGGQTLSYQLSVAEADGSTLVTTTDVLADDGEPGIPGWTTEVYGGSDLWHRSSAAVNSPDSAWWCGIEGESGYDNGQRVGTALVSPPVDLRHVGLPATLTFFENYETEPGFDNCMVDVSADGGRTWIPLRGEYGAAPSGSSGGWRQETLDLSSFVGQIVRVRFYFETFDAINNVGAGWFVDDIRVSGEIPPWFTIETSEGMLDAGDSADVAASFSAPPLNEPRRYDAQVSISSNDPFTPQQSVPVTLDVLGLPSIALPGETVELNSSRDFDGAQVTYHDLAVPKLPAGSGLLTLEAAGDFGDDRTATLSAEPWVLGTLLGTGPGTCDATTASLVIDSNRLHELAGDGAIQLEVRNSASVDPGCDTNRHTLRLSYPGARAVLDFGTVTPGASVARGFLIANTGNGLLEVASMEATLPGISTGITFEPASLQLEANATTEVTAHWTAGGVGELSGSLTITSNDPDKPTLALPILATVAGQAVAQASPAALVATLPPYSARVRTKPLRLTNSGSTDLIWAAEAPEHTTVEPAAGVVLPGTSIDLSVTFSGALASADYASSLWIRSNSSAGDLEIPTLLRVGEVQLERLNVDYTPHYATTSGTVEIALELPADYDPGAILVPSITLNDCAHPQAEPTVVADLDLDGVSELVVQFDAEAFEECMPRPDASRIRSVTVVGEVEDQTWFTGVRYLRGVVQLPGTTP